MGLNQIVLLATQVEEKSLGERMQTALLNTVMGIAIVFVVLLLISALISCFKFINKAEMNAQKKREAVASANAPTPAPVTEAVVEEEELSDDLELVAVITAAIHAYEEAQGNEVPANGLVVRSIRKVNRSKWLNA
ncbi:MAG: OadG family protein [Clostridiales bacterium]|nr:OadG family protein [Clostridiales bacterium]